MHAYNAPFERARCSAASVSAVSPDCEMAITTSSANRIGER